MTTAQHDRLNNEKEWILSAGTAAHQACRLGGVPLPENCVDPSFGTAF